MLNIKTAVNEFVGPNSAVRFGKTRRLKDRVQIADFLFSRGIKLRHRRHTGDGNGGQNAS